MRTPPLLADFSHARACKPFCENSLTLPLCFYLCDFFDLMHTTKETETPADLKNLRVFFVLRHHVLFPKQREIRKNIV